jgi:outer membrane protein OmpA-like peptidoglycan-associated protein
MLRARKRKGFGWTRWSRPWLYETLKLFTRLKGSTISIGGHTDAVGSDALNQNLSQRRVATINLVDNFKLPSATLHSVGFGKRRPKNKADVFAPENRRVEIVNETQARAQR